MSIGFVEWRKHHQSRASGKPVRLRQKGILSDRVYAIHQNVFKVQGDMVITLPELDATITVSFTENYCLNAPQHQIE